MMISSISDAELWPTRKLNMYTICHLGMFVVLTGDFDSRESNGFLEKAILGTARSR